MSLDCARASAITSGRYSTSLARSLSSAVTPGVFGMLAGPDVGGAIRVQAGTVGDAICATNSPRTLKLNRLGSQAKSGNWGAGETLGGAIRSLGGQRTDGHQSLFRPSVGDSPIGRTRPEGQTTELQPH